MSPRLVLQFLGLPQVHLDDQPVATDRRKAIALLAYLAVSDIDHSPQRYSRESLSALFWPDYEQSKAFSNLRRTIWEVHQAIGEGWLIADRESVHFNQDAKIDLDIAHFQKLISRSRQQSSPETRIPPLIESTRLYRNHFLTGFSLKDAYSGDARRQAFAVFRLGYDRPDRQLASWEQAIALFREAGDLNFVANLLCVTARFRILLTGDIEKAQQELGEAMAIQLGSLNNRNIGIGGFWEEAGFARSLIALLRGDYEQAYLVLQDIVTHAEAFGNRMGYFWTRVNLGYVALRAGNLTEARTIFAETARVFQKDGNTIGVVFTLEGLASLFVAVGKPEHAAYLVGWADAVRERIINPRPFLEQADVDKAIAACLARMGEVSFLDAYEEGKRMTFDQAVTYAVESV